MPPPSDAPPQSRAREIDEAAARYGPVEAFWRSRWRPARLVESVFGQPASEWLDLSSDFIEHVPVAALLSDGNLAHLAFRSGAEAWTNLNDDDLAHSMVCTDRALRLRYPDARIETRLLDFGRRKRSKVLSRIVVQSKTIAIGDLDLQPLRREVGSDDHIFALCMGTERNPVDLADRMALEFDDLWRDSGRRDLADEARAKLTVIGSFSGLAALQPQVRIDHLFAALWNAAATGIVPRREKPSSEVVSLA